MCSDWWENLFSRSELTWPSVKYYKSNFPVLDTHYVMHIIDNGTANCKCKADAEWARPLKSTFYFKFVCYNICNSTIAIVELLKDFRISGAHQRCTF